MSELSGNRAAGRGDMAIHADIEASTLSAKMQAMRTSFDPSSHACLASSST